MGIREFFSELFWLWAQNSSHASRSYGKGSLWLVGSLVKTSWGTGKAFGCSLCSHNLHAICLTFHDSESIREITYNEACLWCIYRVEDRIYFHTFVRAAGWDQCFTPLAMKKGILRDKERSSSPLPCKDLTSQLTWVNDGANIIDSDQMDFYNRPWRRPWDSMTNEWGSCCKLHEGRK